MTDLPSRFHATPAEIDAYLRTILAEDTYLRFQQTIGEHAIAQTVEDTDIVRAAADNEGLYNNDWREGWDDYRDRVDPDRNDPYPVKLIEFPATPDERSSPVDLSTPCARPDCEHTLNWHTGKHGCVARGGACSCSVFQPPANPAAIGEGS
jgi:hypothetical protein